jgi:magnesium chelatase family protein
MDLLVDVQRPRESELHAEPVTDSAAAAERVAEARSRQLHRLANTEVSCNGQMDARAVRRHVRLDPRAEEAVARSYSVGALSARGRHRVLRLARTIADLEGRDGVLEADVLLALSLRQRGGCDDVMRAA